MKKAFWEKVKKRNESGKAEKTVDGDDDELVSCLLTSGNKKEKEKKKVLFNAYRCWNVVQYWCRLFLLLHQNYMDGKSGASCQITNNNTSLIDVTKIYKSIQGSSGSMLITKKGKLHVNVHQVDSTEWIHTLWLIKFCPEAVANLFSLMHKLSQGNNILNDQQNNIGIKCANGDIVLDCWIKTCDGWVAIVEFLHNINEEKDQSTTVLHKKNVNNLHVKLGHPSKAITHATAKAMGIQVMIALLERLKRLE